MLTGKSMSAERALNLTSSPVVATTLSCGKRHNQDCRIAKNSVFPQYHVAVVLLGQIARLTEIV
jgi:hypothetical protein